MVMAFVHPAAVAPFLMGRRRALDGTALVVGSVAADFEYFATLSATQRVHPGPIATFVLGVVVGIALTALVDVVGVTLAEALPPFAQGRLGLALRRRRRAPADIVRALVSVVVGALTHVAWDAVAEHNGALHHSVPWRALATWSTPVGLAVLVVAFVLASRHDVHAFYPKRLMVLVASGLAGAASCALLRDVVLGGDVRDVTAAASGGAIFGVACALVVITVASPANIKPLT